MYLVSSLSVHFLNWSGISERLLCHLSFFYFSSFPLSSLFPSSFHGSCQCLVSVTGQCCRVQVALCVCVCECVLLYLTRWHSCSRWLNVWPSTLCLFRPLLQTVWGIRGSVCVSRYILDTRPIITQTAVPLQGQDRGYFKVRVCVSAP